MPLTTYDELQASIISWSDRGDLADLVPDFIALAEAEFNRVIWTPDCEATATLTVNAATTSLPAGFRSLKSIYVDSDPRVVPEQVTLSELVWLHGAQTTGPLSHFALQAGNTLRWGPSPQEEYSVPIVYYEAIEALSDSNPTNWLLASHPDIYHFGAMVQFLIYADDEEHLGKYQAKYGLAIDELTRAGQQKAYGNNPVRIRSAVVV